MCIAGLKPLMTLDVVHVVSLFPNFSFILCQNKLHLSFCQLLTTSFLFYFTLIIIFYVFSRKMNTLNFIENVMVIGLIIMSESNQFSTADMFVTFGIMLCVLVDHIPFQFTQLVELQPLLKALRFSWCSYYSQHILLIYCTS